MERTTVDHVYAAAQTLLASTQPQGVL